MWDILNPLFEIRENEKKEAATPLEGMTSLSKSDSSADRFETRDLRITIKLELGPNCPLRDPPDDVHDIELQLLDSGCQTDFVIKSDSEEGGYHVRHEVTNRDEDCFQDCVCYQFQKYNCVPRILKATEQSTYFATYLRDREMGSQLINDLKAVCDSVQLVQLSSNNEKIRSQITEVDCSALTEKQKLALRMATDADYFVPGDGGTLVELAEELDISASALSQRISRAEAELLEQIFG